MLLIDAWTSIGSRSRSVAAPTSGPRPAHQRPDDRPRPFGDSLLSDPFDVLEATLGPRSRVVRLDDAVTADAGPEPAGELHVVRTADRTDHPAGNAVHHITPLTSGGLAGAVADLDRRFPRGRARLVVPHTADLAAAAPPGLVPSVIEVLRRHPGTAAPGRSDLDLATPGDDRDWHGITVLHRHAAPAGEDRSRGRGDDRLRWWVAGLRELVGTGRARVLRASRFGTPVGVGVLHWEPGAVVDDGHAGLAVVADVVVHPAHRGIGVARSITEALVDRHLADFPRACVTGLAEHGAVGAPSQPPTGWQHEARLLAFTRPEGDVAP